MSGTLKRDRYLNWGRKFVEGWMWPGAERIVATIGQVQIDDHISGNTAEIGIYHGKLFILLYLLGRESERAVAVDLFGNQDKNIDNSGCGDLAKFLANLKRYADDTRLVVYEGDSTAIDSAQLIHMAGGPCRLISIDGGHTPEITAHDLTTAEGALSPGGVIILDDCFHEMWPGVSEGVNRYFSKRRGIVPFATGANKTLFSHPKYAPRYVEALRRVAKTTTEHNFLGARVLCCDFSPRTFTDRVRGFGAWRAVQNLGPIRIARRAYYFARRALSH